MRRAAPREVICLRSDTESDEADSDTVEVIDVDDDALMLSLSSDSDSGTDDDPDERHPVDPHRGVRNGQPPRTTTVDLTEVVDRDVGAIRAMFPDAAPAYVFAELERLACEGLRSPERISALSASGAPALHMNVTPSLFAAAAGGRGLRAPRRRCPHVVARVARCRPKWSTAAIRASAHSGSEPQSSSGASSGGGVRRTGAPCWRRSRTA